VQAGNTVFTQTQSTQIDAGEIERQRIEQLANRWEVTPKEWLRYEEIMQGEGRYHWKDADPILVLGMYAKTPAERDRYALMMAKKEFRLQSQFIAFNRAYLEAFDTLYGEVPIIDLEAFYQQYRKARMKTSIQDGNQGAPSIKDNPAGDRYVLFLNTQCARCDEWFGKINAAQLPGTAIDLYFIGESEAAIGQWAQRLGIDPKEINSGQITLNQDSGMYIQYGRPALPAAYYYDASTSQVQGFRDTEVLP
jgi:integrating conjugative element protein (TIGR03759 family)